MTDYAENKIMNRFTLRQRVRMIGRKINLSWALGGRDALILIGCGVLAGMLIGFGLLVAGW